ncbi:hypothetical protein GGR50DRAFT_667478 [Xylaria sp. CBS 124048]|nr:hypothetical protein GGR50DRAFT_667478 [Xylaria sp. CBS 124048]
MQFFFSFFFFFGLSKISVSSAGSRLEASQKSPTLDGLIRALRSALCALCFIPHASCFVIRDSFSCDLVRLQRSLIGA